MVSTVHIYFQNSDFSINILEIPVNGKFMYFKEFPRKSREYYILAVFAVENPRGWYHMIKKNRYINSITFANLNAFVSNWIPKLHFYPRYYSTKPKVWILYGITLYSRRLSRPYSVYKYSIESECLYSCMLFIGDLSDWQQTLDKFIILRRISSGYYPHTDKKTANNTMPDRFCSNVRQWQRRQTTTTTPIE